MDTGIVELKIDGKRKILEMNVDGKRKEFKMVDMIGNHYGIMRLKERGIWMFLLPRSPLPYIIEGSQIVKFYMVPGQGTSRYCRCSVLRR